MQIPDVNVAVAAFRPDHQHHEPMRDWLRQAASGTESLGISELVLSAFVRIVTNPRFMARPDPPAAALAFADQLLASPRAVVVRPGARHWAVFRQLCLATGARGNRVPDAYLASIAIEAEATFVTADVGFARFPGLRWIDPLSSWPG